MFGENYLESNFIQNYGNFADEFLCVNNMGSPSSKVGLHMVLFIVLLIITIILFVLSTPKKNKKTNKKPPRTTTQNILLVFAILSSIGTVGNIGYYLYLYVSCYLPQRKRWFVKLPQEGKLAISQIQINKENQQRISNLETRQTNLELEQFDYTDEVIEE